MKQLIKILFIFLVIAVLPACGPHYKKRSLSYLQQAPTNYIETKDNVTLEVKKLDKAHTKPLFDGQGRYLSVIDVQPLYFHISNNDNKTFFLHADKINLVSVNIEEIKCALAHGNWPVLLKIGTGTIGTGCLLYFTAAILKDLDNVFFLFAPVIASAALCFMITIPFVIGNTVYSSYQLNKQIIEYNQDLHQDIDEKNMPATLKIPADTAQEFLFFADAQQFKNSFDITITEKLTEKPLTFNVTL